MQSMARCAGSLAPICSNSNVATISILRIKATGYIYIYTIENKKITTENWKNAKKNLNVQTFEQALPIAC